MKNCTKLKIEGKLEEVRLSYQVSIPVPVRGTVPGTGSSSNYEVPGTGSSSNTNLN
jgi:hypothetical protein